MPASTAANASFRLQKALDDEIVPTPVAVVGTDSTVVLLWGGVIEHLKYHSGTRGVFLDNETYDAGRTECFDTSTAVPVGHTPPRLLLHCCNTTSQEPCSKGKKLKN